MHDLFADGELQCDSAMFLSRKSETLGESAYIVYQGENVSERSHIVVHGIDIGVNACMNLIYIELRAETNY